MAKLTFYEQVGIVIPGSVLMAGLLFFFPALNALVPKDGVTLGQFGIFMLLSYAAGHLVAAAGNVLEPMWKLAGGMPTDWVTRADGYSLLNADQVKKLTDKGRALCGSMIANVAGYDALKWYPISRQIYADVAKNGKPQRIDTFNGNYGLNRGLCASTLLLALTSFVEGQRLIGAALLIVAAIYGYRAYRFGGDYGGGVCLRLVLM